MTDIRGFENSIKALDLKPKDEIICPVISWVASANAIVAAGCKPVFVDVNLDQNINASLVEKKITKKTKAIALVHHLGNPANMKAILKIAKKNDLLVLEDCATALGAKIDNKHVGNFGNAGVFSFYPIKHITTKPTANPL